ncbi:hypothetical protein IFM89_011365 [Coptis chinensis]|uniref:Cyclin-like domain-containing protein n=1 Tax=Coptis chinensis TaxID=261450 RepID=A0A835HLS3_9MAGN|nr:hypothetical protein IFM89_011365 [Coptis chinensis]
MEECSSLYGLLLCKENEEEEACFNEGKDSLTRLSSFSVITQQSEDEYIKMLIETENSSFGLRSFNDTLMRVLFGFCFQTAYLSISYFDRFLSKRSIDSEKPWAIQLLSVACLTLAAKMEECRVPALSEFRTEEFYFESKVIQRMELLVLNTLEWRMALVTPFAYLHYFITKLSGESRLKDLVSTTVGHVLAIVKEMTLMDQRPSTIAAAAVLAASSKGSTSKLVELKMSLIPPWQSQENDNVFTCYTLMLELEMEKVKTPKYVCSPDLSSIYSSSSDVVEDSSFTSATRIKRRRLTFHDTDEKCDIPNENGLQ